MAALLLSGESMLAQHMPIGMNHYLCMVNQTLNILNSYNKITKGGQHFKSNVKAPDNQTQVDFAQSNATKKQSTPPLTSHATTVENLGSLY